MEWLVALTCVLLVLWLAWRWRWTSQFEKLGIPGPKPNLIFGNILELYRKGPLVCHQEWVKKYGRVLGYYYGMKPVLLVADPHLLKNIFIKDFAKFINREAFNPLSEYSPHSEMGQSVLILPGQAWKDVRSILTPTFTTAKMKQMSGSMKSSIEEMLGKMEESDSKGEVDASDVYQRLTMDVITRTAFGVRTDVQTNPKSRLLHATKLLFNTSYYNTILLIGLSFPILRRVCIELKDVLTAILNRGMMPHIQLQKGIKKVLQLRRKSPQAKNSDLLQLMIDTTISTDASKEDVSKLEAGNVENEKRLETEDISSKKTKSMTDAEIVSSAVVVLLAGYETTSTALSFTTYLLAKHQDTQEQLFHEVDELLQSGQKLEYATVNKLQYLDKVLCESMRLYPPVNLFCNRFAVEDVTYGDLRIPTGTLVQAPVHLLHHDPELWSDPETFDPERFNDKPNSDGICYLPFGVGPRNCLGMRFAQLEAKLALANVIHKFHITLGDRHKDHLAIEHKVRMLTPRDGVYVRLDKR